MPIIMKFGLSAIFGFVLIGFIIFLVIEWINGKPRSLMIKERLELTLSQIPVTGNMHERELGFQARDRFIRQLAEGLAEWEKFQDAWIAQANYYIQELPRDAQWWIKYPFFEYSPYLVARLIAVGAFQKGSRFVNEPDLMAIAKRLYDAIRDRPLKGGSPGLESAYTDLRSRILYTLAQGLKDEKVDQIGIDSVVTQVAGLSCDPNHWQQFYREHMESTGTQLYHLFKADGVPVQTLG